MDNSKIEQHLSGIRTSATLITIAVMLSFLFPRCDERVFQIIRDCDELHVGDEFVVNNGRVWRCEKTRRRDAAVVGGVEYHFVVRP